MPTTSGDCAFESVRGAFNTQVGPGGRMNEAEESAHPEKKPEPKASGFQKPPCPPRGPATSSGLCDGDGHVWSAIRAFEQILDAIPNDRASLEALSNTYEQIGDLAKAKPYMLRLANVLMEEGDVEETRALIPHVTKYATDDPTAQKVLSRMKELC